MSALPLRLQEGCPFLSPFSLSDECLESQQQLTTALSSRKRVEAVGISISCGLEDRWGFPGTGRRCGGDRLHSKYGDL